MSALLHESRHLVQESAALVDEKRELVQESGELVLGEPGRLVQERLGSS